MENKKKYIIMSIVGGIFLLVIGVLIGFVCANKNAFFKTFEEEPITQDKALDTNQSKNEINTKDATSEVNTKSKKENKVVDTPVQNDTKSSETVNKEITTPVYSTKDNAVIEEMTNTLNNINTESSTSNFSDKAKGTFVSIVDFLFYGGSIKGITFNELTDSGKQKVLELANKIDVKLEEKVPGYKDKISSSTRSAYNKASQVIKNGASNLNNFAKEKLGDENYNSIIDSKDELVKYSKNALNLVENAGSKLLTSTKDKLNEWYQNFKNNR